MTEELRELKDEIMDNGLDNQIVLGFTFKVRGSCMKWLI